MPWLALALLAAFFLATADAVTKRYLADFTPGEMALVRFGATAILLLPLLAFTPWPHPPPAFWGWVAALLPLEILAMWLYMQAIRDSPLSLTLPYLAFTPVFNILTGQLLLGETVSAAGFAGILLVVSGAWLLNAPDGWPNGRHPILDPFKAIIRERGARLMLTTAALYSLTSVMGKGALHYVSPLFFGPFYFTLVGMVTAVLFAPRHAATWRRLRTRPLACLAVGLFMAAMLLCHFHAIIRVEVAYMIAVKRTSLLFGMVYGAWLFKEPGLGRHLAAGALMVAGVLLLAG